MSGVVEPFDFYEGGWIDVLADGGKSALCSRRKSLVRLDLLKHKLNSLVLELGCGFLAC